MASNALPKTSAPLIALAAHMVPGLLEYGGPLGITQMNAAQMQAALDAFTGAETTYNALRSAKGRASGAWTEATAAVKAWLGGARTVLAASFGQRWSPQWAQTGFAGPSTAVPPRIPEQLGLALFMANFLANNPQYEMPLLQMTAARAGELRATALAAQAALTAATQALDAQDAVRAAARTELVRALRVVIGVLGVTLAPDDTRWLAFGLNMPGAQTAPAQPQEVQVWRMPGGKKLQLSCDPVPLATRYRWRARIVGSQAAPVLVASGPEPQASIAAPPPGQVLEITAEAVNGSHQGAPSAPVSYPPPG